MCLLYFFLFSLLPLPHSFSSFPVVISPCWLSHHFNSGFLLFLTEEGVSSDGGTGWGRGDVWEQRTGEQRRRVLWLGTEQGARWVRVWADVSFTARPRLSSGLTARAASSLAAWSLFLFFHSFTIFLFSSSLLS
jgi:hypothetical protein